MLNNINLTKQNEIVNIRNFRYKNKRKKSNVRAKSSNINLKKRFGDNNNNQQLNPLKIFDFKKENPNSSQRSIYLQSNKKVNYLTKDESFFLSNQKKNVLNIPLKTYKANSSQNFPLKYPAKTAYKQNYNNKNNPLKSKLPLNRQNKSYQLIKNGSNNSMMRLKKSKNNSKIMDDNISMKSKTSKYSTTSKRHRILRAVSINNQEHLFNLKSKEDKLKKNNEDLINYYINNLKVTGNNIQKNLSKSFLGNINKIWESYIRDQKKNGKFKVNETQLNKGVHNIKGVFNELLNKKTEYFIDNLRLKNYQGIFESLENKKNEKIYLDDDVSYLMKNQYNDVMKQNSERKNKINQFQKKYLDKLKTQEMEFNESVTNQLEAYENEFIFKFKSENAFVLKTLKEGFTNLKEKDSKVNSELNYISNKNNEYYYNQIESEINQLEEKIQNKKNNF